MSGVLSASGFLHLGRVLCRIPAMGFFQIYLSLLGLSLSGEFLYLKPFLLLNDLWTRLVCLHSMESPSPALHCSAGVAAYCGDQLWVS